MSDARSAVLARALALSHRVLEAADQSDLATISVLDGERMRLLKSARADRAPMSDADQRVIAEVAALNDRAIGAMEHQRRIKERALDMAAVGRRAVAAYAQTGPRR